MSWMIMVQPRLFTSSPSGCTPVRSARIHCICSFTLCISQLYISGLFGQFFKIPTGCSAWSLFLSEKNKTPQKAIEKISGPLGGRCKTPKVLVTVRHQRPMSLVVTQPSVHVKRRVPGKQQCCCFWRWRTYSISAVLKGRGNKKQRLYIVTSNFNLLGLLAILSC